MYTLKQKIVNQIQRHAIGIILILLALLLLSMIVTVVDFKDSIRVSATGILNVGAGTALILFVTKYAYPKLNIQERIKDDSKAVAVFAAGIAIAIALLF